MGKPSRETKTKGGHTHRLWSTQARPPDPTQLREQTQTSSWERWTPLIFIVLVQHDESQGVCALANRSGGTWRELREKAEEKGFVDSWVKAEGKDQEVGAVVTCGARCRKRCELLFPTQLRKMDQMQDRAPTTHHEDLDIWERWSPFLPRAGSLTHSYMTSLRSSALTQLKTQEGNCYLELDSNQKAKATKLP